MSPCCRYSCTAAASAEDGSTVGDEVMAENYSASGGDTAQPVSEAVARREGDDTRTERSVLALLACLCPSADASLLLAALDAACAASRRAPVAAERELARVRTQLSAGENASRLRHAVNNPLTALVAEAQLLEMEPLGAEHLESVARIVALARRVIAASRQLDGGVPVGP